MYAAAVLVPLVFGVVALVLVCSSRPPKAAAAAASPFSCITSGCAGAAACMPDGTCSCPAGYTGADCSNPPSTAVNNPAAADHACSRAPRACTGDSDCAACASAAGSEYVCTDVKAAQTGTGVAGKYCAPAKPVDACKAVPAGVPADTQIPGEYFWQGWRDVEAMAWTCNCPFPEYYPADATDGGCKHSENLCRGGTWAYPCTERGPDGNSCITTDLSLVGASPLTYGACDCSHTACASAADCVPGAECSANVCTQRAAMDASGVPTCIPDTCAPGKWVAGPHAMSGTALAGVYGACECPPPFESTGTTCIKKVAPL